MLFFSLLLHQLETGLTVKLHAGAYTHHVDYMQTETLWMLLKCKVAKKKNLAGTAGFHWNKGMNEWMNWTDMTETGPISESYDPTVTSYRKVLFWIYLFFIYCEIKMDGHL